MDLIIYRNSYLQSNWYHLLKLILIGSGTIFILNFQLFKITKKNSYVSLIIAIFLGIFIKLFTFGDPIFEMVKLVTQSKQMAFSLIFGGISLILIETISLRQLSKKTGRKLSFQTKILDDFDLTA